MWAAKEVVDNRGNTVIAVDETNPITVRAAFIPQRSGKAEVSGQQQINVTPMSRASPFGPASSTRAACGTSSRRPLATTAIAARGTGP